MTQPDIKIPAGEDLKTEGTELVAVARALPITSQEEYTRAGEFLRRVARLKDEIVSRFKEPKQLAHRLHKSITETESGFLALPTEAERVVKRAMGDFLLEDEKRRRLEEARIREEQREREEADRIARAEALDRAGDTEAAVQVLDTPVALAAVEIEKPKAEGVSYRSVYKFEVVNPSLVSPKFLIPDMRRIQAVVDGMKLDAASIVGGIRVYEDRVLLVRR